MENSEKYWILQKKGSTDMVCEIRADKKIIYTTNIMYAMHANSEEKAIELQKAFPKENLEVKPLLISY